VKKIPGANYIVNMKVMPIYIHTFGIIGCLILGGCGSTCAVKNVSKFAGQETIPSSQDSIKGSNMPHLSLTIKLKQNRFVVAESLPIDVILENYEASPVEVPDPPGKR
jgi:hypothetical protein